MGGGGDVRVSLTGEVMEVPQPTARGTGPGGYGPPPGAGPSPKRPGSGPMPAGPPRARGAGIAYEEPRKKGSPIGIILLVILLLGGGAGGWWWYNNRTNPKDQALLAYKSILKQDWRKVVDLVAWPTSHTKADEDQFVKGAEESYSRTKAMMPPGVAEAVENMEVSVGDPTISGSTADVPTTGKMSLMGRDVTLKGTAHMVREGGIWKLDFTQVKESDPASVQKVITDLVGQPDASAMGGPGMGGGAPGGGGGRRGGR